MATNTGKWEVVGKGGKSIKNGQANKKNKTKVNEADLPKLEIKEPIPKSKTQFDAFTREQQTPFVVPKEECESDSNGDNDLPVEAGRKHERRHKAHSKEPQISLAHVVNDAVKECDLAAIKACVSESKQNYSNNSLVVLKELVGFFHSYFEEMPVEKDPVLADQQPGFPLCCLADDVQDFVLEELNQWDEDDLDTVFGFCVDEMLIEINKGRATYGIRMMIQCLLKSFSCCKEHLDRVKSRKNNSREALSLLWTLGQTSDHTDFMERMKAWSSFMLPVFEAKQLSRYVIEYLEVTLSYQPPKNLPYSPLTGNEFQYIMELTFATTFQHFPYRKQLQLLYPEIKGVVFAAYPNTPLTSIFSRLFDSLSNDRGDQYLAEALSCLVECLEKDASCHHEWRNNYLGRLKESSLLLKALAEQWESVCRSIPRKYLSQTLHEFHNINKDLKLREKHKTGLSECETSCKILLTGLSSGSTVSHEKPSGNGQFFKFLFYILLALVCVDLYRHQGYKGSKTSNILKRYGVERALGTTYKHSKVYIQRLESWTQKRYPYYYKKAQDVIEPASEHTMIKLSQLFNYVAEVTTPARAYLHKTVPPLLEKIEAFLRYYFNLTWAFLTRLWHTYYPPAKRHLQHAWDTLVIYIPLAWARAREITWNTGQWIYNLSPDFFDAIANGFHLLVKEVVTRTPRILALVQEYLLTAWKLVVSGVTTVVVWFQENVFWGNAGSQGGHGRS